MSKFSIEKFINEETDFTGYDTMYEDLAMDISKELVMDRRFSLSIPEDVSTPNSPPLPPMPPSPKLKPLDTDMKSSNQRFYFDEPESDDDLEPIDLGFSKMCLLITKQSDRTQLKIPPRGSYDARKIWLKAGIPTITTLIYAEMKLLDWALKYARLEIADKTIKSIAWISSSGSICRSTWKAFLLWIRCACSNNVGSDVSQNL